MKIEIRKVRIADAPYLHKLVNDTLVLRNITGGRRSIGQVKKELRKSLGAWTKSSQYAFSVLVDREVVGQVFLENPNAARTSYEIGYFVGRPYWNMGIATKAIRLATAFAFKKGIIRVWAGTFPENPASGRALEKSGFTQEGRLRKASFFKGKFHDDIIWAKIK